MSKTDRPKVKFIKYNAGNIDNEDDPSYPFKLAASLNPPTMMPALFEAMGLDTEDLIVRGMTKQDLDEIIQILHLYTLPRLRHFTITGPDGFVEKFRKEN